MTSPDEFMGVPDTGDLVDPAAEDPTDDEVTDPDDPNYVEPWTPERPPRPPRPLEEPS